MVETTDHSEVPDAHARAGKPDPAVRLVEKLYNAPAPRENGLIEFVKKIFRWVSGDTYSKIRRVRSHEAAATIGVRADAGSIAPLEQPTQLALADGERGSLNPVTREAVGAAMLAKNLQFEPTSQLPQPTVNVPIMLMATFDTGRSVG